MPLTVSFLYHLIVGIFYIFFSTWFSCSTFKSEVRKKGVCWGVWQYLQSYLFLGPEPIKSQSLLACT